MEQNAKKKGADAAGAAAGEHGAHGGASPHAHEHGGHGGDAHGVHGHGHKHGSCCDDDHCAGGASKQGHVHDACCDDDHCAGNHRAAQASCCDDDHCAGNHRAAHRDDSTPVFKAIKAVLKGANRPVKEKLDFVLAVLKENIDQSINSVGNTLLHYGCMENDLMLVTKLLFAGADVNKGVANGADAGLTGLHYAMANGHAALARVLLSRGANVHAESVQARFTPLHAVCMGDHDESANKALALLLKEGAHVNAVDAEGKTPLMMACVNGLHTTVHSLVAAEADLTAKTTRGLTALLCAIQSSRRDAAFVAQLYKLCPEAACLDGAIGTNNALNVAASTGNEDIVEWALGCEGVTEAKKFEAAIAAASSGHTNVLRVLRNSGVDLDGGDEGAFTPLCAAARENHLGCVQFLLKRHANPNRMVKYGETDLHPLWVALFGYERRGADLAHVRDIVGEFLAKGAEVNVRGTVGKYAGSSPLHLAVQVGDVALARLLLRHHADVNAASAQMMSPLVLAVAQHHTEMVNVLLGAGADTVCSLAYLRYAAADAMETKNGPQIEASEKLAARLLPIAEQQRAHTVAVVEALRAGRANVEATCKTWDGVALMKLRAHFVRAEMILRARAAAAAEEEADEVEVVRIGDDGDDADAVADKAEAVMMEEQRRMHTDVQELAQTLSGDAMAARVAEMFDAIHLADDTANRMVVLETQAFFETCDLVKVEMPEAAAAAATAAAAAAAGSKKSKKGGGKKSGGKKGGGGGAVAVTPEALLELPRTAETLVGEGSQRTQVYRGEWGEHDVAVRRVDSSGWTPAQSKAVNQLVKLFRRESCATVAMVRAKAMRANEFVLVAEDYVPTALADVLPRLSTDMKRVYTRELVSAVVFLHRNNVVVGDLHPKRVRVSTANVAKLCGLGVRKPLLLPGDGEAATFAGGHMPSVMQGWLPADVLEGGAAVSEASDMFALGCLLFYIHTGGVHPFDDSATTPPPTEQAAFAMRVANAKAGRSLVAECVTHAAVADLLAWLLHADAAQRPTWRTLATHPYVVPPSRHLELLATAVSDSRASLTAPWEAATRVEGSVAAAVVAGDGWTARLPAALEAALRRVGGDKLTVDGTSLRSLLASVALVLRSMDAVVASMVEAGDAAATKQGVMEALAAVVGALPTEVYAALRTHEPAAFAAWCKFLGKHL